MGPGMTLVILGAILAFAVRTDSSAVDVQTVGLIFMIAGAVIIAYYRQQSRTERIVTKVQEDVDGQVRTETVRDVVSTDLVDDGDAQALGGTPAVPPATPVAGRSDASGQPAPAPGPDPHPAHGYRHGDLRHPKP